MFRLTLLIAILFIVSSSILANDFYVDSIHGTANGDGSAARPWQSLQAVIDQGLIASRQWESLPYKSGKKLKPRNADGRIKGGDTIWLRNGNYGLLNITGYYNDKPIMIAAVKGQIPRFRQIRLRSGSHWILRELHISPASKITKPYTLVSLDSHDWSGPIHDVIVEGCVIQSATNIPGWSKADWNKLACNGLNVNGTRMTIRKNRLKNINFGISVNASHSLIEHNLVENFSGDGMRGLGNHSVFQYNTIKNCYAVNRNHDDGFQSWSVGADGVGTGKVVGIMLRGNTFINYEDSNQPHRGTLQGIGCFDGMFEDWVIENNVVIVDHWHGITLLGATNCRIVNNTVIDRNTQSPGPPWICIGKHKRGTASTGCVIRNNLASSIRIDKGQQVVSDHNLNVKNPAALFENVQAYDLRLKADSAAIDAGSLQLAPTTDITGTKRPQGKGIDLGAYEWSSGKNESPDANKK